MARIGLHTGPSKAISQLDDEQLNWKPNEASHSISSLIKHIEGNIQERILRGILQQEIERNREVELEQTFITKPQLETTIENQFKFIIEMIGEISDEKLEEKQLVRTRERTNLDMLHQCAAHYSEHMGQIFYIAKLCLNKNYTSTSI
ncbi:DinB family protein [Paenibacillus sp. S-38]|uniref:DinB family protein n=1 Tax=Paenibacillus sp. S-38 TaxID=3416710 RepID=UPI003CF0814D